MTRQFPLAGLLRLRKIREDQAAGTLAAANAEVRTTSERDAHIRSELSESTPTVANSAAINAVYTARAASRSMLAELDALATLQRTAAAESSAEFAEARSQSVRLEKLELRHTEAALSEELRAEQIVLDEIASRSWLSDKKEATA